MNKGLYLFIKKHISTIVISITYLIVLTSIFIFKYETNFINRLLCLLFLIYSICSRIIFFIRILRNKKNIILPLKRNRLLMGLDIFYVIFQFCIFLVILFKINIELFPLFGTNLTLLYLLYMVNYAVIVDNYHIWFKQSVFIFHEYVEYKNIKCIIREFKKLVILTLDGEKIPIYTNNSKRYCEKLQKALKDIDILFEDALN